jgi:hypothetical protein
MAALLMLRSTMETVSAPAISPFRGSIHTPRNRCVRFVAGVAAVSRNTRFQAARYALPGLDFHQPIAPASWRTSIQATFFLAAGYRPVAFRHAAKSTRVCSSVAG